jgi:AsmA protein
VDSLIKRSTVTAPLLDALRDRATRDAVQSVLDRLSGGKKVTLPDPAATAAPEPVKPN